MSNLSPAAILFDTTGAEKGVKGNPVVVTGVVSSGERDSFGSVVGASRYNQIEVDFSTADPDVIDRITVTKTSGGDAVLGTGQAVFSTSTAATGRIQAVSVLTVKYRPQAESYAAFTCIFTAGTADSYQRLGIYNATDGFFIGFEGTSFGVTLRKGGVDTTTARASFNLDTLTGAAGSAYTRAGTPEPMDPTKDNLYRIRYGWLGAAPIVFEVFSPDGEWVPFHVIRHPNTVAATTVNSPNLPLTLDARKTAGATNITMSTACWAAGSTSDLAEITAALTDASLAKLTRSVITGQTTGGGGGFENVKVTPSGALTTEINDGGGSITVDGTVTANQGAPNTAANRWPVQLTDGTDLAAVAAASTAAQAGDPALVVGLSPNSPLPAGTNALGTVTTVQTTASNLNALAAQGAAAALSGRWPITLTDGTNTMPTGDVEARSVYMRVTDGTNTMPVGDVVARAAFTQISDGTTGPVAVMAASSSPTVLDKSLVVQISPNQEPIPTTVVPSDAVAANAQGRTAALAANTFTAVRQTTYTEQTTNAQRSFSSSSASDAAAGVGARQIRIEYLDQNGDGPSLTQPFYTETITLNGTTPVNTVATNICFVEHIEVISVGSSGANVGTITMFSATGGGGVAVGSIGVGNVIAGVGDNEVLWAHHYVPNLYACEVYTITGGCYAGGAGGGVALQFLRGKNPASATSAEQLVGDIINVGQGNALVRTFGSPLAFPGPFRLVLYGIALANNTALFASFDFSDRPA